MARVAHRFYWDLVRTYDNNGYNDRIHHITKLQLNRATYVLADLISEPCRKVQAAPLL